MTSKNTSLDQLILNAGIVEEEHPNVNASDASREELIRLFVSDPLRQTRGGLWCLSRPPQRALLAVDGAVL